MTNAIAFISEQTLKTLSEFSRYGGPRWLRMVFLFFWDRLWTQYLPRSAKRKKEICVESIYGFRLVCSTSNMVGMYVQATGRWEPSISAWIQSRLGTGDTFVDVGANIGYYSLLAAQRVGATGQVVAIEPSPSLCTQLYRSLELNSVGNVRVVQMAISDGPGSVKLFRGPATNHDNCRLHASSEVSPSGEIEAEVPAGSLVDALTRDERLKTRLVKVDIENMEPALNAGLKAWLAECRHDLEFIIELHPGILKAFGKLIEPLLQTFSESGFRMYNIDNTYRLRHHLYNIVRPPTPLAKADLLNGDGEFYVIFSRLNDIVATTVS